MVHRFPTQTAANRHSMAFNNKASDSPRSVFMTSICGSSSTRKMDPFDSKRIQGSERRRSKVSPNESSSESGSKESFNSAARVVDFPGSNGASPPFSCVRSHPKWPLQSTILLRLGAGSMRLQTANSEPSLRRPSSSDRSPISRTEGAAAYSARSSACRLWNRSGNKISTG